MKKTKKIRVMWLLHPNAARKFELSMLKAIGIDEIFTPKLTPNEINFQSAHIEQTFNQNLSIPSIDLDTLNATDWYYAPSLEAWEVANKYFDIVFFTTHNVILVHSISKYFRGALIWRVYELESSMSYGKVLRMHPEPDIEKQLIACGRHFRIGYAYDHLERHEHEFLQKNGIYLPLGIGNSSISNNWEGREQKILFVCPEIGFNSYYKKIYEQFKNQFADLPHIITGTQPIEVNDPTVLGFVSDKQHEYNMTQYGVMFYHSQEPNHIHYHPFEAIRTGMPLVFMAGGILDKMGGSKLPGRCKTMKEARLKIERILNKDLRLIDNIRASQHILLKPMKSENCEQAWRDGLRRIVSELESWRVEQASRPKSIRRKRIAIILPVSYRGKNLREALAVAQALYLGSRKWQEDADIVFLHLDDSTIYPYSEFENWPDTIIRRPFNWKVLSSSEARRAMRYAGFAGWEPTVGHYMIPDDGMQQLLDCDLWMIISDRIPYPILPLKPVVLMIYDYLQRYENILANGADQPYLLAARSAERVLVTTEFTQQDVLQYAGVEARKISKVPMIAPEFTIQCNTLEDRQDNQPYFIWTTNAAPHKNHQCAAEALRIYYEEFEGKCDCKVSGVDTKGILTREQTHLKAMADVFGRSPMLRKRVKWMGELPDTQYRNLLAQASFLWHAGRLDNGTFSVIEAAYVNVPSLSSDYPAMREIDVQFSLNLTWMKADSPRNMAEQLKLMERESMNIRKKLPTKEQLKTQNLAHYASTYWQEVRSCL